MAIIQNLITRKAKQSVGGLTLYQLNGQTVVREKQTTTTNPRSNAQMLQRAKLKNTVAFYQKSQPWMKSGAFQSKPATYSDYNAFVQANTGHEPVFLTKEFTEQGGGMVLPYTITRGTLPSVEYSAQDSNYVTTNLNVDPSLNVDPEILTVASLTSSLLANNNGLREGMQISTILYIQRVNDVTGVPFIICRYNELVLSLSDGSLVSSHFENVLLQEVEDGHLNFYVPTNIGLMFGVAIVLSEGTGKNIKVSTQNLSLSPSLEVYIRRYQSASAFRAYVRSYGLQASDNFLATGYTSDSNDSSLNPQITGITVNGTAYNVGATDVRLQEGDVLVSKMSVDMEGVDLSNITYSVDTESLHWDLESNITLDGENGIQVTIPTGAGAPGRLKSIEIYYADAEGIDRQVSAWFSLSNTGTGDGEDVTP